MNNAVWKTIQVLAANRVGIKAVIIPKNNEKVKIALQTSKQIFRDNEIQLIFAWKCNINSF